MTAPGGFVCYPDRPSWLAARQQAIGGSDAPVLFGESRFANLYMLWAEKTGLVPRQESADAEPEWIFWGRQLEDPIASGFAQRHGYNICNPGPYTIWRHGTRPYMQATLDRIIECPRRGPGSLSIKNVTTWREDDWAGDEPPMYVQIQLQHELACTGLVWGAAVALVGGGALRVFETARNDDFIAALERECEAFWGLVESKTPPPVDGSIRTRKMLQRLHPRDSGHTVDLPADADEWDADLRAVEDRLARLRTCTRRLEGRQALIEQRFMQAMGDATYAHLPSGTRYSLRTSERSGYTVGPKTMRTLRRERKRQ